MKFVWIFGPQAVGKMTVGQELEKLTGFKLFYNHMTLDFTKQFFDDVNSVGCIGRELVNDIRHSVFTAFAKSDKKGLIFTTGKRAFHPHRIENADEILAVFENEGIPCYLVELEATLDARLARNVTENRLKFKPYKKDIEKTTKHIMDWEKFDRFSDESHRENYIKIDNTNLSAEEVANIICEKFNF